MSNPRWQVEERDGKFLLEVRVDSDARPDRELVWEGEIAIGHSGGPSLGRIDLKGVVGPGSREDEQPGVKRDHPLNNMVLDNSTNSGRIRDIIRRTVRKCVEDSSRFEEIQASRAKREDREQRRAEETAGQLRELAMAGMQEEAAL